MTYRARSSGRPARLTPPFVLLAALIPAAAGAAAPELADLALEDLLQVRVSSATGFEQPTTEAPATTTIIDADELRQHGYRNIAEALVTVPGVYASGDRSYTYLGIRGFNRPGDYGTRLLLLTDGARRNDPLYDQALTGNEAPIEIDWVKRLEFVSGPASAIYGANAVFGTANAVMLDGGDINGARVTVDRGSSNTRRLGIVAGQRLADGRDWFVGFATYKSRGENLYFRAFDNGTTNGQARGLDTESYNKAYGKYRWGAWRLTGNFSWREKGDPTANYGTAFGEPGTNATDQSRLLELRYEGEANGGWQPSFRLYNGNYRFVGNYNYQPQPATRDDAEADWSGVEFRLAYSGLARHRLSFGSEAQWNRRVWQRYFQPSPFSPILDTNNPSQTRAVFVQDEWRFASDWLLNLGVRHDRHSQFAGVTSPRVALIWQATPRLTLKAISGSAYRFPNAYERFYSDAGASQAANPSLRPEYVRTQELSSTYRFGAAGRIGASVYENSIHRLIDATTDASGISTYANAARGTAQGVELDAENRWAGGLRLRGSIALQHGHMADGNGHDDSPQRMAKLVASMPLPGGWSVAGEAFALSRRQGIQGAVPGYGLFNLSVLSAPDKRFGQIGLSLYNVANRQYWDPAAASMTPTAIEQARRQVRLRWTLDL